MHSSLEKLNFIKAKVNEIIKTKQLKLDTQIVVISKTFPIDNFEHLIKEGHSHFGENKVQEAYEKWSIIKNHYKNLKIHMVGKLQTNKVNKAVKIFDYIHSLDNEKLALKIRNQEKEVNKKIKLFIQVNLANEDQKSGISPSELDGFYKFCVNDLHLNVVGLMCLPPANTSVNYFKKLNNYANKLNLKHLSMGMSSDYENAVGNGSTFLRIGTAILGKRTII